MVAVEVPEPMDFLAEWGIEPVEAEEDRLYWAYDLRAHAGVPVMLSFCGMESWLGTSIESGEASSSTLLDGLKRLRFVDSGKPMRALVGDFSQGERKLHVTISVFDGVKIEWTPSPLAG